jgi:peroxiredoxin
MNNNTPSRFQACRQLFLAFVLTAIAACGPAQDPSVTAADVPDDPADVRPLLPGMSMPAFSASDPDGNERRYAPGELERPLVVTFYRGGWCPYCSRQLMAYLPLEEQLTGLGYALLFISPDRPEVSKKHLMDADFDMTLLSDSDMEIARGFGVARYLEEHQIDIEGDSGRDHHYLPVPATYIIGTDGVVRFMYANPNYRVRLDPTVLLSAAQVAASEDAGT